MKIFKRAKNFLVQNVEGPMIKFVLFSIFDACVGATGMLLYGIFTAIHGPVWVRNQYIGLWLLTLILFTSAQSLYIEVKSWTKCVHFKLDLAYFSIQLALNVLMFIFYVISGKIDASIWSFYLLAVNVTNLFILYSRRTNLESIKTANSIEENQQAAEVTLINEHSSRNKRLNREYTYFRVLRAINVVMRFVFVVFSCFIVAGAAVEALGKLKYPSRGTTVNVNLNGADKSEGYVKVHYLCSKNSALNSDNLPIFMIEGDGTHGLVDYLSLHKLLSLNNRTSCIWDKPGAGLSDYLYDSFKSFDSPFYHSMITSILANEGIERANLAFVGWGSGGGDLIYQYAYDHPEMVGSLTFLDVAPNNIEFLIKNKLSNFSQSEANTYKDEVYASRQINLNLINGIGVPLGIVSLFEKSPKTFFNEFDDEIAWYYHTEKKWATQNYLLPLYKNLKSSFDTGLVVNKTMPLNVIMTFKTDEQIVEHTCKPRKFDRNSTKCIYEINFNRMLQEEKSKLVNLTPQSKLIKCEQDECDTDFFVGQGANYTVFNLLNLLNL